MKEKFLKEKALWVRQKVMEMCLAAGAGHIAPAYSWTDIAVALYYGGILRIDPKNRFWEDRDRFILSKGQACASLYAILADLGFFPVEELMSYCQTGSRLGGHSESHVPGVEAFTGSLGHGLSIASGMALAAKIDKKDYFTYVLLGDGELQEGSNWEAAMFAAHHKLDNLIAIVDRNMLQAIDFTEESLGLEPLEEKWKSFGWKVSHVDGHDFKDMIGCFKKLKKAKSEKPSAVIAHTTKGKGVSFMENRSEWHFRIPEGEEIEKAKEELGL